MDDAAAKLRNLVDYWTPLLLRMSVEAGIVEAFGHSAQLPAAVAAETGTHAPTLARVLRALASRGVFDPCPEGAYRLSALGRRLLTSEPDSLAGLAAFRPWEIHAWAEVDHTRKTGEPAFPQHFGHGFWDHLAANPPLSKKFNEQMQRRTATMLGLGLSAYDWPAEGTIVDVGGGNGLLLSQVLQRAPGLRGVLFDLPHVVEQADRVLRAAGVESRVETIAGNVFTDPLPRGHEIYVLASVLHDWSDTEAESILARCRAAVPTSGRLLLFESVLPEGPQQDLGKMVDLHMLVLFGAKERTEPEWHLLLQRAGFAITKIVPTRGLSWIEAVPFPVE